MKHLPAFLLSVAVALWSCSKPDCDVTFISVKDSDNGIYEYEIAMQDSLASYDFSFYTRVDGKWEESIRFDVEWIAPDGGTFSETVYFGPSDNSSGFLEQYRTAVIPVRCGDWRMRVRPYNVPDGFRGLGLMCKENGTRQTEEIR